MGFVDHVSCTNVAATNWVMRRLAHHTLQSLMRARLAPDPALNLIVDPNPNNWNFAFGKNGTNVADNMFTIVAGAASSRVGKVICQLHVQSLPWDGATTPIQCSHNNTMYWAICAVFIGHECTAVGSHMAQDNYNGIEESMVIGQKYGCLSLLRVWQITTIVNSRPRCLPSPTNTDYRLNGLALRLMPVRYIAATENTRTIFNIQGYKPSHVLAIGCWVSGCEMKHLQHATLTLALQHWECMSLPAVVASELLPTMGVLPRVHPNMPGMQCFWIPFFDVCMAAHHTENNDITSMLPVLGWTVPDSKYMQNLYWKHPAGNVAMSRLDSVEIKFNKPLNDENVVITVLATALK